MAKILGFLRRRVRPLELTVLRVCLLLVFAAILIVTHRANQSIGDYYCGPYRVIESNACATLNSYMSWHTIIVASVILFLIFLFIVEIQLLVVLTLFALFVGSNLTVLGLWIAVQYFDVSVSTREVVTINEDAGIFFNGLMFVGVSGFFGLLCINRWR